MIYFVIEECPYKNADFIEKRLKYTLQYQGEEILLDANKFKIGIHRFFQTILVPQDRSFSPSTNLIREKVILMPLIQQKCTLHEIYQSLFTQNEYFTHYRKFSPALVRKMLRIYHHAGVVDYDSEQKTFHLTELGEQFLAFQPKIILKQRKKRKTERIPQKEIKNSIGLLIYPDW